MKPIINLEETIGHPDKIVGSADSKEVKVTGRKNCPTPFVPRGVFRFHTHEEADEWMEKMLARRRE